MVLRRERDVTRESKRATYLMADVVMSMGIVHLPLKDVD
jgi:hypothetical protein